MFFLLRTVQEAKCVNTGATLEETA